MRADPAEIEKGLQLLHEPGEVFEVRAPNVPYKDTCSGFFNDLNQARRCATRLSGDCPGVYHTLNPVSPDLLARANNRWIEKARNTTSDRDIIRRRWLPIDLDPKRPAGISSTDAEHANALELGENIRDALTADGWPAPVLADSGNGSHLLFRVDLPNDEDAKTLIAKCLRALDAEFSNEAVGIDLTTYNASRIFKVYGTLSRKGDAIPDRPHRLARIIEVPRGLIPVPLDLLQALAARAPATALSQPPTNGVNGFHKTHRSGAFSSRLNVPVYLADRGLPVKSTKTLSDGRTAFILQECPFDPSHGDHGEVAVFQSPDGTLGFKCHHASCAGNHWAEFKNRIGKPVPSHYDPPLTSRGKGRRRAASKLPSSEPVAAESPEAEAQDLAADLSRLESGGAEPARRTGKPFIVIVDQDPEKIGNDLWKLIQEFNQRPDNQQILFRFGANLSCIELDDGKPFIRATNLDRCQVFLSHVAQFMTEKKVDGEIGLVPGFPSREVIRQIMGTQNPPVPTLLGITGAPIFAADGTLHDQPGYNAATRRYYHRPAGLSIPSIPENPSLSDVADSASFILTELLGDFPFTGDAERAHAIAALLFPFARDLIDGPSPIHLVEKPGPGSGATLLASLLALPAVGNAYSELTEARDDDEWRKRVTATLRGGRSVILIDNLKRHLDNPHLASVITSDTWQDRLLGVSETTRVPNRALWLATGNNPGTSGEMVRRIVRIRIDPKMDKPWLRGPECFRHPALKQWAMTNRGRLIAAALTIIRGWIAAGRPPGKKTLGMFESWAAAMGGILDFADIQGFLGNLQELYSKTDAEGASWRLFLSAWWTARSDSPVKVGELITLAGNAGLNLGEGAERSQMTKLGKMLNGQRDRVYRLQIDGQELEFCIQHAGMREGSALWVLEERFGNVEVTIERPGELLDLAKVGGLTDVI
jgi:hypothetical protein